MLNAEKNDKASFIAQQVMHRMGQDGLNPTPGAFATLYAYYSGMHPEISRVIESYEREKKKLTTSVCEDLFDAHLSPKKEKAMVDEATRKVQAAIAEISDIMRSTGVAHKEYNQNLLRQSDNLAESNDINEMKKMISALVDDTRRMVAENQKLEEKLQTSSQELQQMRQDMHSLKQEAMTDTLTGMPNRKAFDVELKMRASEALDKGRPLSLIMIDIDYFKVFNDTFGHQVGDQVLKLVAKTIQEGLKPNEMLARYGGEEFAVVANGLKMRDAEKLAEKLRERIAAKDIINQAKNEKLGRLSISLGVAQLQPGEPLTHLIDRSDRALYKAKAAGRNTVIAIEYDSKLHGASGDIVIDTVH